MTQRGVSKRPRRGRAGAVSAVPPAWRMSRRPRPALSGRAAPGSVAPREFPVLESATAGTGEACTAGSANAATRATPVGAPRASPTATLMTSQTARRRDGGNAWESNPPRTLLTPDRGI